MSLQPMVWLSFEEAEDKVRPLRILSMREYVRLFKQKKLPKGLPSDPPRIYKNKGWVGWPEFLGYERDKMKRGSALPFREAREFTRSFGIKSISEYKKLHKQGGLPKVYPADPSRLYKGQGWVDWFDFLGNKRPDKLLSFEEAEELVKNLGIRTIQEYTRLCRHGKLPKGLPICPDEVYKDKGWANWYDYLGCEPHRIKPPPFEELKKTVRELGIKNSKVYKELRRQGKLPKGLPYDPNRGYKGQGWTSWYDFFGNEPRPKMLPFKEVTEIVRKLGIKGKEEYQRLHKEGKLPKGLPYEPHVVYSKETMSK